MTVCRPAGCPGRAGLCSLLLGQVGPQGGNLLRGHAVAGEVGLGPGLEVRARRVLELILKTGWPRKIDFPISAKNPLFLFPNGQTCVILKECMCVHFTLTKEERFIEWA